MFLRFLNGFKDFWGCNSCTLYSETKVIQTKVFFECCAFSAVRRFLFFSCSWFFLLTREEALEKNIEKISLPSSGETLLGGLSGHKKHFDSSDECILHSCIRISEVLKGFSHGFQLESKTNWQNYQKSFCEK